MRARSAALLAVSAHGVTATASAEAIAAVSCASVGTATPAFCGDTPRITRLVSANIAFAAAATSAAVIDRHERLHERVLVVDAGRRFALQEVVDVLLHVRIAFRLVALRVGALVAREHPLARAVELAGAEAILLDAIRLHLERRQPALDLPVLHARGEREGADRWRERRRRTRPALRNGASALREISSNRSFIIS